MNKIELIVMDVDGTMTDGKINMGVDGELFKAFDIKDGYAIHELLPSRGVRTVILTGRKSEIVSRRASELEVDLVIQGEKDKVDAIKRIAAQFRIEPEQIAYIGDDMADYSAMSLCGVRGCPQDAASDIKKICEYVACEPGGHGAIRGFAEWLITQGYC